MKRWEGAGEADRKKSGGTVDSAASSRSLGAGVVLCMYSRARAGVAAKAAEAAAPQSGAAAAAAVRQCKGGGGGPGTGPEWQSKVWCACGAASYSPHGLWVTGRGALVYGIGDVDGETVCAGPRSFGIARVRLSHARTPAAGRWV